MDQNAEVIHDFEYLLKNQGTKKLPGLYEKQDLLLNKPKTALVTCRARDVLEGVSRQVQALQNADTVSCKQVGCKLDKYKNRGFLSVDMIPVDEVTTVRANNFETQLVSNTQLIFIIENAEIIDKHRGVTQEFDTTFCQRNDDNHEIFENTEIDKNVNREQGNYSAYNDLSDVPDIQDKEENAVNITSEMNTLTCLLPKDIDSDCDDKIIRRHDKSENIALINVNKVTDSDQIGDADIPTSLVLNTNRAVTPPLVYSLYAFERFENVAHPVIEEYTDIEIAKKIINSQIIGKELFIPNHTYTGNDEQTPVLGEVENENMDAVEKNTGKCNLNAGELTNSPESVLDKNFELGNIQSNMSLGTEFKDDILFSSDEEEDYVHKDIQELPLTYALETSFYDKSDILDKTMYVGFQTASNKSIQISTDSFSKAKSILSDVDSEKTSLKTLVDIFDSEEQKISNIEVKNKHSIKTTERFPKMECGGNSNDMFELKIPPSEEIGDKLKNVSLTDLEQQEDERKDDIMMSQVIEFKSVSTPMLKEKNNAKKNYKKRKFEGFKTTSNKVIRLSEKSSPKCRKVFHDIDLGKDFKPVPEPEISRTEATVKVEVETADFNLSQDIFEISDNSDTEDSKTKSKCKKEENVMSQINDLVILQEFEDNDMNFLETNNNCFVGFKTAGKKDILITEEALVKSKDIFHDIITSEVLNSATLENGSPCNTDQNDMIIEKPLGSKITTKTKVKDSQESFAQRRNNLSYDLKRPSTSSFVGFKTAANNNIKISKETLEKFKNFYKEIDEGYKASVIEEKHEMTNEIERENKVVEELALNEEFFKNNLFEIEKLATPVIDGFHTASKKVIPISEKALAKSKKIFEDITECENDEQLARAEKKPLKNINGANGVNVNGKDFTCGDGYPLYSKKKEAPMFRGFQTASDKKVKISDDALARSKRLFQDMELSQTSNPRIETMTIGRSNIQVKYRENRENSNEISDIIDKNAINNTNVQKFVVISSEDLAKSKEIFREHVRDMVENDDVNSKPATFTFAGFQTASNKNIKISTKALAKSKQLVSEFELNDNNNMVESDHATLNTTSGKFVGFQTASDKKVQISKDALVKTKELLRDFESNDELKKIDDLDPPTSKFVGFHTASNKEVTISNDALIRSKNMIDKYTVEKTEQEARPAFKGFQTASNKNVVISEKALMNSKKLFQDLDIESHKEESSAIEKENRTNLFRGFQTANNKIVEVSEKALANSKKLFEDIEISQLTKTKRNEVACYDEALAIKEFFETEENIILLNDINENNSNCVLKTFKGFHTASDKKVIISEDALVKTKAILKNMHEPSINPEDDSTFKAIVAANNSDYENPVELETEINIKKANTNDKDTIDTQLLNDFQDSLNTEDFCKSTPKSKRSGSPILSCPRAKKRKFKTPYKSEKKIEPMDSFIPPKPANTYKFKENYKKNKKYTLRDFFELNKDAKIEIDPYVSAFNFERLTRFEFINARNDYTDGKINIDQLKNIFLDAVNKKIVPDGWLNNHIQLLIWKLLSYEIKFPNSMKNVCTVRNVLDQLKYRYDKELYNVERPILRKILEKDDVPSKTMVLCVAGIYVDDVYVASLPNNARIVELLVTDGWYTVRASLDRMLSRLVSSNTVKVGCKLVTSGAELVGCEQGKAPWEDLSTVRLRLSGNSTRRARWLAPLGGCGGVIRSTLRGAGADGGRAAVLALVVRVYPPLYAEKREGSTVTLSERLEHIRQMQFERERQTLVEKIYEELEKELADQESQDSEGFSNESTERLETGSQICKRVKSCLDPEEYRAQLSASQNRLLEEHNAKRRERKIEEIRVKFREKLDISGLETARNVVPLLKVRVADFKENDRGMEVTTGYLSIWKPSTDVVEIVKEGAWVEILNVLPTGVRNSEIQLSAGRQTVFRPYKPKNDKFKLHTDIIKRKSYKIKELAENPSMTTYFNEIDTTGMIFDIEPSPKDFDEKKNNFQNVFMADADKNMICVNFWGGIKKFGFEYIIDTGQIITCVNLQKRAGNTRKSIPQYRVTEFTCFTKTPKDKQASEITKELTEKLVKIKEKFCDDCVALKNNFTIFKTRNNENVSPYRVDGKNLTPLRCDANLNLTGLDFESTFKDTEISPMALLRKKQVNEKIQKLRMYGEPPPLSSIHIINKSKNASANYKSPLPAKPSSASIETHRLNVASAEKSRLQSTASPVSLNRTYVKKINPVKLNFSNNVAIENDLNDSVDHFTEEFESSPPLSLDSDVL